MPPLQALSSPMRRMPDQANRALSQSQDYPEVPFVRLLQHRQIHRLR